MTDAEYNRRQREAMKVLRDEGLLRRAQDWIHENRPPDNFKGTPLEWAILEMPAMPKFLLSLCKLFGKKVTVKP